jgi:hypothetical protein
VCSSPVGAPGVRCRQWTVDQLILIRLRSSFKPCTRPIQADVLTHLSVPLVNQVDPFDPKSPIKQSAISYFPPDMFFVLRVVQLLRGLANGEWSAKPLPGRVLAAAVSSSGAVMAPMSCLMMSSHHLQCQRPCMFTADGQRAYSKRLPTHGSLTYNASTPSNPPPALLSAALAPLCCTPQVWASLTSVAPANGPRWHQRR